MAEMMEKDIAAKSAIVVKADQLAERLVREGVTVEQMEALLLFMHCRGRCLMHCRGKCFDGDCGQCAVDYRLAELLAKLDTLVLTQQGLRVPARLGD